MCTKEEVVCTKECGVYQPRHVGFVVVCTKACIGCVLIIIGM